MLVALPTTWTSFKTLRLTSAALSQYRLCLISSAVALHLKAFICFGGVVLALRSLRRRKRICIGLTYIARETLDQTRIQYHSDAATANRSKLIIVFAACYDYAQCRLV